MLLENHSTYWEKVLMGAFLCYFLSQNLVNLNQIWAKVRGKRADKPRTLENLM